MIFRMVLSQFLRAGTSLIGGAQLYNLHSLAIDLSNRVRSGT
jgi:hypothetical protein